MKEEEILDLLRDQAKINRQQVKAGSQTSKAIDTIWSVVLELNQNPSATLSVSCDILIQKDLTTPEEIEKLKAMAVTKMDQILPPMQTDEEGE